MEKCYFCLQNDCLNAGSDFDFVVGSCLLAGVNFIHFYMQKFKGGGIQNSLGNQAQASKAPLDI
jgi:hypothetical protein